MHRVAVECSQISSALLLLDGHSETVLDSCPPSCCWFQSSDRERTESQCLSSGNRLKVLKTRSHLNLNVKPELKLVDLNLM